MTDSTGPNPIRGIDALKKIRDEAGEAAEQSLETDETSYQAYERMEGRAQYFIDILDQ